MEDDLWLLDYMKIMERDFIYVEPEEDQEVVADMVTQYNYLALPVLDADRKLAGIVTVNDVIDIIRKETSEDMIKMAGAVLEKMKIFS